MKITRRMKIATEWALVGSIIWLILAGILSPAHAQVYNKFGPSNGILKGSTTTYQTSAATSSDILTLLGSQSANTALMAPNGSPGVPSFRTIVGADVPPINLGSTANGGVSSSSILLGTNGGTSNGFFSVAGPATSLKTFTFPNASATVLTTNAAVTVPQGGTGLATLTANGVMLGEGTSSPNFVVMGADTVLRGTASADPVATSVPNCGSSSTALNYSTSTHAFGCQTISVGGTGTVTSVGSGTGLTGGPITTSGTLSIDQTAALTWTSNEIFSFNGEGITAKGTTTGAANLAYIAFRDSGATRKGYVGDAGGGDSDTYLECDTASCNIQLVPGSGGGIKAATSAPFFSANGTTGSVSSGVATTVFTAPGTGNHQWLVSCSADSAHIAAANVTSVSGGLSVGSIQSTGASVSISGQNIQCTQTTGGSAVIGWSVMQWGQ